jgi:hypothetical protein
VDVTPAETLAQLLADARRRGELFEQAFPAALEVALAGEPGRRERQEWQAVFTDQVDVWRGAFERRPADQSGIALRGLRPDAVPVPT